MSSVRCASVVVLSCLTGVTPAHAQERKVEIVIAGSAVDAAELEKTMQEPLNRLRASLHVVRVDRIDARDIVTPTSSAPTATVHVWFDVQTPGLATIYMADEAWERVLVRRITLAGGLDEVGREALAFVVRNAVGAMLDGARIGVSREEAKEIIGLDDRSAHEDSPRDRAEASRSSRDGSRPLVAFGLAYEAAAFAKTMPITHGPALSLAVGDRAFRRSVWLTGTYRMPGDIETDEVDVHVTTLATRVGLGLNTEMARAWWLSASLGGGVDWIRVDPRVKEGVRARLSSVATSWTPSVRSVVGVGFAVRQTMLLLQAGMDLDLSRTRYEVDIDGVGTYVLSPWPVRPVVTFSMLLGTHPFDMASP